MAEIAATRLFLKPHQRFATIINLGSFEDSNSHAENSASGSNSSPDASANQFKLDNFINLETVKQAESDILTSGYNLKDDELNDLTSNGIHKLNYI